MTAPCFKDLQEHENLTSYYKSSNRWLPISANQGGYGRWRYKLIWTSCSTFSPGSFRQLLRLLSRTAKPEPSAECSTNCQLFSPSLVRNIGEKKHEKHKEWRCLQKVRYGGMVQSTSRISADSRCMFPEPCRVTTRLLHALLLNKSLTPCIYYSELPHNACKVDLLRKLRDHIPKFIQTSINLVSQSFHCFNFTSLFGPMHQDILGRISHQREVNQSGRVKKEELSCWFNDTRSSLNADLSQLMPLQEKLQLIGHPKSSVDEALPESFRSMQYGDPNAWSRRSRVRVFNFLKHLCSFAVFHKCGQVRSEF